ncbi:MAG TPA: hypothetical protein VJQ09_08460 [Candidatus Limnocylindria bacterium]|nr:hypothetical protein [Candidatus Limnocylindria bacterium]
MNQAERKRILAETAEKVALLNEFRTEDFRDGVARLIASAREVWRDENGELPRRGESEAFDALIGIADEADGSPIAVRDAADRALRVAGRGAKAAR